MRKLFAIAVVTAVLLGVVGTAFAEHGSILPLTTTKASKVRLLEHGSIWPF